VSRIGIAVAGASCSGKTTLASALAERLEATLVRVDDYYLPLDHLTYDERCDINFDHPCTIDHELLTLHVRSLLAGEAIEAPRYDFTRHTRFAVRETLQPTPFVIVEGLFPLCYPDLVELCDVRIFVDAPEDVCLERRLDRDVNERGRTPGEVISRYHSHVLPMYRQFVEPSGEKASVRVSGLDPTTLSAQRVLDAIGAIAAAPRQTS